MSRLSNHQPHANARRWIAIAMAGVPALTALLWNPPPISATETGSHQNSDTIADRAESGELMDQLEQLDQKLADVEDLVSDFEQRRYTPLLKKPIVSTGRVIAIAGQSRWDTFEPYASVMRIGKGRLELYYPEQKTLEVYPIEARLGELAASPMPRLTVWRERFNIAAAEWDTLSEDLQAALAKPEVRDHSLLVRLTPKDEELAEKVAGVLVVIDIQTGLSRAMSWRGSEDDESTEILFSNAKTNSGVDSGALAIDLPAGAKVVYPLGPVKSDEDLSGE